MIAGLICRDEEGSSKVSEEGAQMNALRLLITLCVLQRGHEKLFKRTLVLCASQADGVYDKGVVPFVLPVVIFAVRAPNWI